jgi:hypothetical protein
MNDTVIYELLFTVFFLNLLYPVDVASTTLLSSSTK